MVKLGKLNPNKIITIILGVLLIVTVVLIWRSFECQSKKSLEYFTNPHSLPKHFELQNLISSKSGNFKHDTIKWELDSRLQNKRSIISLESSVDPDTNEIITMENPFSQLSNNNPLQSNRVLRQQSHTNNKVDGGWVRLNFSHISSRRVKACLWVAYSTEDMTQTYTSPKYASDTGLFVFDIDGAIHRPTVNLIQEHRIDNNNDNEETIIWKFLESEIDLTSSQNIKWMIGPIPKQEKGYRFITGVRLIPQHRYLYDFNYPVGLQGFLHATHPVTSSSPALTWKDLSHHQRDFVWSPDFPKSDRFSIKRLHLNLNTNSDFGWSDKKPLTLVMKFNRYNNYQNAIAFEALKPNGKVWLRIELSDDGNQLRGTAYSEESTHLNTSREFKFDSASTQTLVFTWNPNTNVFRVRVPDSSQGFDSNPNFFIKGDLDTSRGSRSIRVNSKAGNSHGWDVGLEYLFWYDRELDNSEIHQQDPSQFGGGGRNTTRDSSRSLVEGFTTQTTTQKSNNNQSTQQNSILNSIFGAADRLSAGNGGGQSNDNTNDNNDTTPSTNNTHNNTPSTNNLDDLSCVVNGSTLNPCNKPKSDVNTLQCRTGSSVTFETGKAGFGSSTADQQSNTKNFIKLLEEEIQDMTVHKNSLDIIEAERTANINDPLRLSYLKSQFDKQRRSYEADISERRLKIVELNAILEGKPQQVGIILPDGTTLDDKIIDYSPDSDFERYRENYTTSTLPPENEFDQAAKERGYIKKDSIPCWNCNLDPHEEPYRQSVEYVDTESNVKPTFILQNGPEGSRCPEGQAWARDNNDNEGCQPICQTDTSTDCLRLNPQCPDNSCQKAGDSCFDSNQQEGICVTNQDNTLSCETQIILQQAIMSENQYNHLIVNFIPKDFETDADYQLTGSDDSSITEVFHVIETNTSSCGQYKYLVITPKKFTSCFKAGDTILQYSGLVNAVTGTGTGTGVKDQDMSQLAAKIGAHQAFRNSALQTVEDDPLLQTAVKAASIYHNQTSGGGGGGDPYSNLVNGDDNLLGHNHSQSDNFRQRYGSGLF